MARSVASAEQVRVVVADDLKIVMKNIVKAVPGRSRESLWQKISRRDGRWPSWLVKRVREVEEEGGTDSTDLASSGDEG